MSVAFKRFEFGRRAGGALVEAVELRTAGVSARVLTLGAIVQALHVPDRRGVLDDIVLGHDTVAQYEAKRQYFGATVGRCANRIAGGTFRLDGQEYRLDRNEGTNHLHGGTHGCDLKDWTVESLDSSGLTLRHVSPEGEGGYPGALEMRATFHVGSDSMSIEYEATGNVATIVNLTHHGYFNLAGEHAARTILEHELTLHADAFTPIDLNFIPTGQLRSVASTPFDFTRARSIGSRLFDEDPQLRLAGGFDHNFVLRGLADTMREAARVADPLSGRILTVSTDAPGLQFYSGNFLDGTSRGKTGRPYQKHAGLCLEPQVFPNAPNVPHFPSARLDPGARYRRRIEFWFSLD